MINARCLREYGYSELMISRSRFGQAISINTYGSPSQHTHTWTLDPFVDSRRHLDSRGFSSYLERHFLVPIPPVRVMPKGRASRKIEHHQNALALEQERHEITRQKLVAKCDELSNANQCIAILSQHMASAKIVPMAEAEEPEPNEAALEEILVPPKGTRGLGKQLEECLRNNKLLIAAYKNLRKAHERDKGRIVELQGIPAMPKLEDDRMTSGAQEKQSDCDAPNDICPSVANDNEMGTVECSVFKGGELVKIENVDFRDLPHLYQALAQDHENLIKHDGRTTKKYNKTQEAYTSLADTYHRLLSNYKTLSNSTTAERVAELEGKNSELQRTILGDKQEMCEAKERIKECDDMKRSLGGMRQQFKADIKEFTMIKKALGKLPFFADEQHASKIDAFVEMHTKLTDDYEREKEAHCSLKRAIHKREELAAKYEMARQKLYEGPAWLAVQAERKRVDAIEKELQELALSQ